MWKPIYIASLLVVLLTSKIGFAEDTLDESTRNVIRSACHGYALDMLPEFMLFAKTWLYKESEACKDIVKQGDNFDLRSTIKRHNIHLSRRDLARLFSKNNVDMLNHGGTISWECNSEYKCNRMRSKLVKLKIPMTQLEYNRVAQHCKNSSASYDCIEKWINEEWIQGSKKNLPKNTIDINSLNIDELLSAGLDGESDMTSIDGFMLADSSDQNIQGGAMDDFSGINDSATGIVEGDVGFEHIYAGRQQVKVNGIKQVLFSKSEVIADRCQCVFNEQACFETHTYSHKQLAQSFEANDKKLEANKESVCEHWYSQLRGKTSNDLGQLNQYIKSSNVVLDNLGELDSGYDRMIAALDDKEWEINRALERRKTQQKNNSSFDFGKALALGVGTVVGAGMGGLGSEETINLLGKVVMDSMGGVEGTSNFNQGIEDLTNERVTQLDNMANINKQVQSANNNQESDSLAGVDDNRFDELIQFSTPGNIEKVGAGDTFNNAKIQRNLCNASGAYPRDASQVIFWNGGSLVCSDGSAPERKGGYWSELSCGGRQLHRKEISRCSRAEYKQALRASCEFIPQQTKEGRQLYQYCLTN